MPVSEGQLVKFTVKSHWGTDTSNPFLNTFYYRWLGAGALEVFSTDATQMNSLNLLFKAAVIDVIAVVQGDIIVYDSVLFEAIEDPSLPFFETLLAPLTGAIGGGQHLPKFNVFSFRLNRSNGTTRNGQKRFSGIVESTQTNGVVDAGLISALNDVATALAIDIMYTVGVDDAYLIPVIARIDPITQLPTLSQDVSSAVYTGISTQNSRKN